MKEGVLSLDGLDVSSVECSAVHVTASSLDSLSVGLLPPVLQHRAQHCHAGLRLIVGVGNAPGEEGRDARLTHDADVEDVEDDGG